MPKKLSDEERLKRQAQEDREHRFEQMMKRCPHADAVESKALRNAVMRALRE